MQTLIRLLLAETLKLRRTLAAWMALLVPAALVFLEVAFLVQRAGGQPPGGVSPWLWYYKQILLFWAVLMLPLFITLETALLGAVEHGSQSWKMLFAQPAPRWMLVAAKQCGAAGLTALGTLALLGLGLAGGEIVRFARPELGFSAPIPWGELLRGTLLSLVAAGVMLAVQTWTALRWRSFVVACGVGIALTTANLMLTALDPYAYLPWGFPAAALEAISQGADPSLFVMAGGAGGLLLSVAANLDLGRREID